MSCWCHVPIISFARDNTRCPSLYVWGVDRSLIDWNGDNSDRELGSPHSDLVVIVRSADRRRDSGVSVKNPGIA